MAASRSSCALLAMGAIAAASPVVSAHAHWCHDLWASSYNLVLRPASDVVPVPSTGSATLEVWVQNNMGYPLQNFALTAQATGYTINIGRRSPKVSGYLMPGEKLLHTLTISRAGGASLAVDAIGFFVSFGSGSQSGEYPQAPGQAVAIKKVNGTLAPAGFPNLGQGWDQAEHLANSALADYGDLNQALNNLLQEYCAGRASWDHSGAGVQTTYCPDLSRTTCPPQQTTLAGTKYDWQKLWSAQELAYRKGALGARLGVLRNRLKCGWADANLPFRAFPLFVLGYLGEDAGARTFLQQIIDQGSADDRAVATASLLLLRNAQDLSQHRAAVVAAAGSSNKYVAAISAAALGIVDHDDTKVEQVLLQNARWVEPDTSDNGYAFFVSHLLALVAWDRRGWAAGASDVGAVSFYPGNVGPPADRTAPRAPAGVQCTATPEGNMRLSWAQVIEDINGGSETVTEYRAYWGTSPGDRAHVESVGATFLDQTGLNGVATYYYSVVAVDAAGNVSASSLEVSCKPVYTPVARISCSPLQGAAPLHVTCDGGQSTDPNGAGDIVRKAFALDGQTEQAIDPVTYDFSAAGRHTVLLRVTDRGGLTATAQATIDVTSPVNHAPVARAQATPTRGQVPLQVAFASAGSSDPDPGQTLSYRWDFRDGSTSSEASPRHTFNSEGTYEILLTVTDDGSPPASATAVVSIAVLGNQPPDVSSVSATPLSGQAPLIVHFDAAGVTDPDGNQVTLSWSFGDGTPASNAAVVDHTFASPGSFTAVLSAQDDGTPSVPAARRSFTVTVGTAPPPPDQTAPKPPTGTQCTSVPEGRVRLSWGQVIQDINGANETVTGYRARWGTAPGDRSHVESVAGTSFEHASLDGATTYYYSVVAVDAAGNVSGSSAEVACKPAYTPLPELRCTPLQGLAPLRVACDASQSSDPNGAMDIARRAFALDGQPEQVAPEVSYDFTAAGRHTVVLTVVDSGGLSATAQATLEVQSSSNRAPVALAAATPNRGQAPLVVNFSSAGSNDPDPGQALSHRWDFGDGEASTEPNPAHSYGAAGAYQALLTVTDSASPPASATSVVAIEVLGNHPPEVSSAVVSPLFGRPPLVVHFDASGVTDPDGNRVAVTWGFGDGSPGSTAATIDHVYSAEGSFTVELSAQDDGAPAVLPARRTFVVVVSPEPTENRAPDCTTATISPTSGTAPLAVTLDASGCTDPDGQSLSFVWRIPTSYTTEETFTTPVAHYVFANPGMSSVRLLVRDSAAAPMETSRDFTLQVDGSPAGPRAPSLAGEISGGWSCRSTGRVGSKPDFSVTVLLFAAGWWARRKRRNRRHVITFRAKSLR